MQTHLSDPAARSRPGCKSLGPRQSKRAQGMPGDGLTHGPPATKKAGGSHHRISRINRHSLRNGFTACTRPPRCPGLIATVTREIVHELDPSVGRSGPRDFAVRIRHVRLTCRPRPSHPHLTCRDDRPKRPSSSRRDARDAACDLPDEASAQGAADWHDGQNGHGIHAGLTCQDTPIKQALESIRNFSACDA
jgi:hypothetical protein